MRAPMHTRLQHLTVLKYTAIQDGVATRMKTEGH